MIEKEYREWVYINLKVKETTKEKYINAIKTLSLDARDWGFGNIDLYTKEGIKYIKDIMESSNFVIKNKRGNNMYSCALKHYLKFIQLEKIE